MSKTGRGREEKHEEEVEAWVVGVRAPVSFDTHTGPQGQLCRQPRKHHRGE